MPIEFAFLDYLQTLHTPLLDELMLFITTIAGRGELALVVGAALLCFKRSRKVGLAIIAAMVIGYLLGSVILKPSIARVRPCNVNLAVEMLVERIAFPFLRDIRRWPFQRLWRCTLRIAARFSGRRPAWARWLRFRVCICMCTSQRIFLLAWR